MSLWELPRRPHSRWRRLPKSTTFDLLRFVEIDGWTEAKTARGKTRDHHVFTKTLLDGRALWTKISHGRKEIGDPRLWHRIWSEQLGLATEEEFWHVLMTNSAAPRAGPAAPPPAPPDWLIDHLVTRLHMTPEAARALSPAEAERRWHEYLAQPR